MITRVTELQPEHIKALKEIGRDFYSISRADGEFDDGWFISVWSKTIESGVGSFWVYTIDDKIVGVLGAVLHPCMFSGLTTATEAFWYVKPEHRQSAAGVKLFMTFIDWARQVGVSRIQSAHIAGSMGSRLAEFYTKLGMKELETIYVLEV